MKKTILLAAILFAGASSQAASGSITGLLGFSQSAVNFGVNYENHLDSTLGMGGFFHFSSEKKDNANHQQTMDFGAMAPAHVLDNGKVDAYIAPGLGILMVKGYTGAPYSSDDQTTFGPAWKVGVLFRMAGNLKLGLERTELVNWFSDKMAASYTYTNAALNFTF